MNKNTTSFFLAGHEVKPGERVNINLPVASLSTRTDFTMPVTVIHGKKPGPVLFVSAAIHGDEINGVEIVRRLLSDHRLHKIRGTLLAIPIVNVFGFINHSRYLPDRKDLNRFFPGAKNGSLAARMADIFIREIVKKSTHGIDLHTGAIHRSNFPQVRARLDNAETLELAQAFSAPVIVDSNLRDGSLREYVTEMGIPMLLYEAGEALRFDEASIRVGLRGVISVMKSLEMIPESKRKARVKDSIIIRSSQWVRAPESGILKHKAEPGAMVNVNDIIGVISDPFGGNRVEVTTEDEGIIIGLINNPIVNEGDALFHIGQTVHRTDTVKTMVDYLEYISPSQPEQYNREPPTNSE